MHVEAVASPGQHGIRHGKGAPAGLERGDTGRSDGNANSTCHGMHVPGMALHHALGYAGQAAMAKQGTGVVKGSPVLE